MNDLLNDEYVWQRTGPPDPGVASLERLLERFGQQQPPPPLRIPARVQHRGRFAWIAAPLAAAAMLAIATIPIWLAPVPEPDAWRVTRLEGSASIATRAVEGEAALPVGASLRTGRDGRALLDVTGVGRVEVGPATHVRLLATRAGDYRLGLVRGTLSAYIWAPPGQFFVEIPSSVAVDLGCAYTLQVDDRGAGLLRVSAGWVGFEWRGRRVLIPAGAVCATRRAVGPGTPHYDDVSEDVRGALDAIDFGHERDYPAALDRVLAAARARDGVTLWHLLQRVRPADRDRVYDRLASLVPPPPDVTRDGIRSGDAHMLDLWWDRLGLGSAEWWHGWSRPWTEPAATRAR